MNKKYRFHNETEEVYEYVPEQRSYVFIGSYYHFNINKTDSYIKAAKKIENWRKGI